MNNICTRTVQLECCVPSSGHYRPPQESIQSPAWVCTAVHHVCVFDHLGFIEPLVFFTNCCIIFAMCQMCVRIGPSQGHNIQVALWHVHMLYIWQYLRCCTVCVRECVCVLSPETFHVLKSSMFLCHHLLWMVTMRESSKTVMYLFNGDILWPLPVFYQVCL